MQRKKCGIPEIAFPANQESILTPNDVPLIDQSHANTRLAEFKIPMPNDAEEADWAGDDDDSSDGESIQSDEDDSDTDTRMKLNRSVLISKL